MSKKLEPLEALTRIRTHNYHEHPKRECLGIIETALKDYETYKMYTCDEFREFVYENDFKSVKNIKSAFNSLIKRNNELKKENKTLKERIILNKASFNMAKQQYEKQLKAFEIIKKKNVNVRAFKKVLLMEQAVLQILR